MAMSRKRPRKAQPRKPAPQPVDEAEPSAPPEVTVGVGAPAAEPVADAAVAESGAEAEAAAPARKPGRPGMSLLDFAKWDQDEPAQTADAGFAPAADEPVAAEPTAEPAAVAADAASAPAALVEMEEAAALDERAPQAAEDAARTGAGETIDAAGAIAEAETPAEQQVETAPEEPGVSRTFIERRRPDITPRRREGDSASPSADLQQKAGTGLSILEKLPVPVLVHSGDTLHYANHEFFALTGYGSVEELSEAGGIGALFADPYADEDARGRQGRPPAAADEPRRRGISGRGVPAVGAVERRQGAAAGAVAAPGKARSAPAGRPVAADRRSSRRASPRCARSSTRRPTAWC